MRKRRELKPQAVTAGLPEKAKRKRLVPSPSQKVRRQTKEM
jgi:hypothetical protein